MPSDQKTRDISPRPRPEILEIPSYAPGKSEIPRQAESIKLSSNESSFGPSPTAIEAYKTVASSLHRYPDASQQQLRQAIAEVYKLDTDKIICGNGSDEILDLIYRCYLRAGDEIILSTNHFVMCSLFAKIQGAEIILADEDNYVTNVDDLLKKVTSKTRMVTIANPNNPTGTYLNGDQIRQIHSGLPSEVLLIIDDAYAEYVTCEDYESGSRLVDEFENVITTHTFSKIYGLSALRIGWAYCPISIFEILQGIRSPFSTNSAAMAAATAAVRDQTYIHTIRKHTAEWLNRIEKEISALGIEVIPSAANFYLLNLKHCNGKSAKSAAKHLERAGIITRSIVAGDGDDVLRITVGLDSENEAVIDALADYMS